MLRVRLVSIDKNNLLIGFLLLWAISSSFLAAFLYYKVRSPSTHQNPAQQTKITATVLINYGNSSLEWHNNTEFLSKMSIYEGLLLVADQVNATHGTQGTYLVGINGLTEDSQRGWVFAVKGRVKESWGESKKVDNWWFPGVSIDSVRLKANDTIAFLYYNWRKYGYKTPPNPTTKESVR